jgi:predicted NUDIX family NTP pyrophosphohydrolase
MRNFPEVDRGGWFSLPQAQNKMLKGQLEFLTRLGAYLSTTTEAYRADAGRIPRYEES